MSKATTRTASPIVFFAVGLFVVFITWPKIKPGYEAHQWPVTTGMVLHAEVQKVVHDEGGESYEPVLKYSYQINGVKRTSSVITYNSKVTSFNSREEAGVFLSRYPTNAGIAVRYNPQKPEESVLIAGYDKQHLISLVIGAGLFLAGVAIFLRTQKLTAGIHTKNEQSPTPAAS